MLTNVGSDDPWERGGNEARTNFRTPPAEGRRKPHSDLFEIYLRIKKSVEVQPTTLQHRRAAIISFLARALIFQESNRYILGVRNGWRDRHTGTPAECADLVRKAPE